MSAGTQRPAARAAHITGVVAGAPAKGKDVPAGPARPVGALLERAGTVGRAGRYVVVDSVLRH
jgi:hypothetical protein